MSIWETGRSESCTLPVHFAHSKSCTSRDWNKSHSRHLHESSQWPWTKPTYNFSHPGSLFQLPRLLHILSCTSSLATPRTEVVLKNRLFSAPLPQIALLASQPLRVPKLHFKVTVLSLQLHRFFILNRLVVLICCLIELLSLVVIIFLEVTGSVCCMRFLPASVSFSTRVGV